MKRYSYAITATVRYADQSTAPVWQRIHPADVDAIAASARATTPPGYPVTIHVLDLDADRGALDRATMPAFRHLQIEVPPAITAETLTRYRRDAIRNYERSKTA